MADNPQHWREMKLFCYRSFLLRMSPRWTARWVSWVCLVAALGCSSRSSSTVTEREPDAGSGGTGGSTGGSAGSSGTGGTGASACVATPAFALGEGSGKAADPSLVWTGDGYAVAWQDDRDGNLEIYFARLDAEGNKVGADVRITEDPADSAAPSLVWASSELALAWADSRDDNSEIYVVRLDPNGTKLGNETRVTSEPARSEFPSLVRAPSGGFAVSWNDTRDGTFQIYTALLDGQGSKLADEVRVSTGTALAASPSLAAGDSGFGVAWHDLRDGAGLQIYFAHLDSSGARIGDELRLSEEEAGTPSVASAGDVYGVAWAKPTEGEAYWVSVDAEGVATPPVAQSSSMNTAAFPALISSGSGYAISWPDGRDGDREIYVAELGESGAKLGDDLRVSDDATASLDPTLAKSSLGYGVAWVNDPTQTTGEVWFATVCP